MVRQPLTGLIAQNNFLYLVFSHQLWPLISECNGNKCKLSLHTLAGSYASFRTLPSMNLQIKSEANKESVTPLIKNFV